MIGDKIKLLRQEKNMSQKDLADILAISTSTVGMYEQKRRQPDASTIIKLAQIFNVTTDYLLLDISKKHLTEDELKWLKLYSEIPVSERSECIGFVKGYIAQSKKMKI
ncbi:helix-turn-helix transcriptional regulator [Kineothrix sedimenti]|uniref:Helix-turn-helix transcriptional regulator n=1 Tax=Kineothrix sedimenti TaxID=3123317 RepID=A0ABZ3ESI0_9FIRM